MEERFLGYLRDSNLTNINNLYMIIVVKENVYEYDVNEYGTSFRRYTG